MFRRSVLTLVPCICMLASSSELYSQDRNLKSRSSKDSKTPDFKDLGAQLKEASSRKEISGSQAREAYRLLTFYLKLDTNNNKILEPKEYATNRSRSDIERRIRQAGMDPARPLDLSVFILKRLKNAGIKPDQIKKYTDRFTKVKRAPRKSIVVNLPEKYSDIDVDNDNQLGLYEWPRNALAEFFMLDRNNDGFLTPREVLDAAKKNQ
jgi:hypothetical protein